MYDAWHVVGNRRRKEMVEEEGEADHKSKEILELKWKVIQLESKLLVCLPCLLSSCWDVRFLLLRLLCCSASLVINRWMLLFWNHCSKTIKTLEQVQGFLLFYNNFPFCRGCYSIFGGVEWSTDWLLVDVFFLLFVLIFSVSGSRFGRFFRFIQDLCCRKFSRFSVLKEIWNAHMNNNS